MEPRKALMHVVARIDYMGTKRHCLNGQRCELRGHFMAFCHMFKFFLIGDMGQYHWDREDDN